MKKLTSFVCSSLLASVAGCGDNLGGEPIEFPRSCLEAGNGADVPDGDYTLYVDNDAAKPWTAYCHGGDEYLTVEADTNYGEIAGGGPVTGNGLRTSYARLRLDPETLKVDITDATFATSTGEAAIHGAKIAAAPLGVAFACDGVNVSASSYVQVTTTPFALKAPNVIGGTAADGNVALFRGDRWMESFASGSCGHAAPPAVTGSPLELTDGFVLELAYAGPLVEN